MNGSPHVAVEIQILASLGTIMRVMQDVVNYAIVEFCTAFKVETGVEP